VNSALVMTRYVVWSYEVRVLHFVVLDYCEACCAVLRDAVLVCVLVSDVATELQSVVLGTVSQMQSSAGRQCAANMA